MSSRAFDDSSVLQALLDRLERMEARMAAMETRSLPADDSILLVDETLAAFEQTMGIAVSGRMSVVEKALIHQTGLVSALTQRAIESDANLQRLISVVERLCERIERPAALPAGDLVLPFHSQLDEAVQRQSESPVPGFRPVIITEEEEKSRHRVPLTPFR